MCNHDEPFQGVQTCQPEKMIFIIFKDFQTSTTSPNYFPFLLLVFKFNFVFGLFFFVYFVYIINKL